MICDLYMEAEKENWIIKANRLHGNKIIKKLRELNAIDLKYKIYSKGDSIFIPLKKNINNLPTLLNELNYEIISADIKNLEFKERYLNIGKSLKDTIKEIIPTELHKIIPRAFDVIGNIAILELNRIELEPLRPYVKTIGQKILENHPNIVSVYEKASNIEGIYRTRRMNLIAGIKNTETIHKENSCNYHVDIEKTFFSPRLVFERQRLSQLYSEFNFNGIIWDVFCGVGSFIIQISKKYPQSKCIGTDINCKAIEFAKKNLKLNKIENKIDFFCHDVSNLSNLRSFNQYHNHISRFIMNLPEKSLLFLKYLRPYIKEEGSLLHIYQFNNKAHPIQEAKELLKKSLLNSGIILREIRFSRVVKPFSPNMVMTALDAVIEVKN